MAEQQQDEVGPASALAWSKGSRASGGWRGHGDRGSLRGGHVEEAEALRTAALGAILEHPSRRTRQGHV